MEETEVSSWLSVYLIAPAAGWLVAQLIKAAVDMVRHDGHGKSVFRAGGMPSAHSSTLIALLTVIGFRQGFDSALFAVVATVTAVVIYDAINVRRSVGEQGDALKSLHPEHRFFVAYGHKITDVLVGAVIGLGVGLALLQIL